MKKNNLTATETYRLIDDKKYWRKLYAGLVVQGMYAEGRTDSFDEIAEIAFKQASAMLTESEKYNEG